MMNSDNIQKKTEKVGFNSVKVSSCNIPYSNFFVFAARWVGNVMVLLRFLDKTVDFTTPLWGIYLRSSILDFCLNKRYHLWHHKCHGDYEIFWPRSGRSKSSKICRKSRKNVRVHIAYILWWKTSWTQELQRLGQSEMPLLFQKMLM